MKKIMVKYRYKPKTGGLGINNWVKTKTAAKPGIKLKFWEAVFKFIARSGPLTKIPVIRTIFKAGSLYLPADKKFTGGVTLNLNADLTDKTQNVVMPIDIVKKLVREASYIAGMKSCICRDAQCCTHYPHDICCMFVGKGAAPVVKNDLATVFTVEEALARIDKAAEAGLIAQALWVEFESYTWGFKDEDLHRQIELCFCCPCCCSALKFTKKASTDIVSRYQSIGWKASVNEGCVNCGICEKACPVNAVKCGKTKAEVDEAVCLGCGICVSKCPESAIKLRFDNSKKQVKDIKEHFSNRGLDLDI